MQAIIAQQVQITESSGNVFQDLGLDNATELLEKSNIMIKILKKLHGKKVDHAEFCKDVCLSETGLDHVLNGRCNKFEKGRLQDMLDTLTSKYG
jgi:predicted XRE-type DNA-binding protein